MINQLAFQLQEMQTLAEQWETTNPSVSSSSVGWHLLHNLQVINGVVATLAASNPAEYAPKHTFRKWYVLLTKKIPRGKARAASDWPGSPGCPGSREPARYRRFRATGSPGRPPPCRCEPSRRLRPQAPGAQA